MERIYSDSRHGRFGKVRRNRYFSRRINAKEILIRQRDDEFTFTCADGAAKLSGRDDEFQESTLRREPTVRREDFNREFFYEAGEPPPTETSDDADARAEFLVDPK